MMLVLAIALAAEPAEDPLALAGMLVRDGHWDRAAATLADVEPSDVDLAQYDVLIGLVALHEGRAADAVSALSAAVDLGRTEAPVWLTLSEAHLAAGDPDAALLTLDAGEALHPEPAFDRHRVALYASLGLYRAALEPAQRVLAADPSAASTVALAEVLRQGGALPEAVALLEEGRLANPDDVPIRVALAAAWLDRGVPLAAGAILQEAVELDPALALEAAECFRRAGDLSRASYLNSRVVDPVAKARQRLGILLDAGEWARATALAPRLDRLGLLRDDAVAYGLAYAWFRAGDPEAAAATLSSITDPAVAADAERLRLAIERCATGGCG